MAPITESQEAKVIITNEKGLSYPLWVYTSLYKEGNRYYLIEVNGSETADALGDSLVYGLYQLKEATNEKDYEYHGSCDPDFSGSVVTSL